MATKGGMDEEKYLDTMDYYSAIKRKNIPPFAETWLDCHIVKSRKEKQMWYISAYI